MKKRILFLDGKTGYQDDFRAAGEELGIEYVFAGVHQVRCVLTDGEVRSWMEGVEGAFDGVFRRGLPKDGLDQNTQQVQAFLRLFLRHLEENGTHVFDPGTNTSMGAGKWEIGVRLSQAGLPTPDMYVITNPTDLDARTDISYPCVIKPASGRQGIGVYKCADTRALVSAAQEGTFPLIVQPWIPNDGDVRALVIGGRIVASVKRSRTSGDINNFSTGGVGTVIDLPEDVREMAREAARVMGLDVAGVDLIQHQETGKWFVLEVNRAPEFIKTQEVADVNVPRLITEYIAETVRKSDTQ